MTYLLDKKIKEKKFFKIAVTIVVFLALFYFRLNIWNSFSYATHAIFRPVLVFGNNIGDKLSSIKSYFYFKKSLFLENENLKSQIKESEADRANYISVVAENESLKEILGRKKEKIPMVLSAILSKPNQSPYDTLVIDAGTDEGLKIGNIVFALGDIPVGRIAEVYTNSSKVILFTNAGEKTQALVSGKNISMELVGRGGGNFEMILPRDLILQKDDQVTMPGINPYVLAIAKTTISDPRDPFTKALLTSPVNIQELKFVQVEPK